ncbi:MAG: ABC transporter ATP-binding protein [Pseudomonadota bacterium]
MAGSRDGLVFRPGGGHSAATMPDDHTPAPLDRPTQAPDCTVANPADAAISARGLVKQYGDGDQAERAVDNLSFDIPFGASTALLGGNGAGKTTTMAMLLGLLTPTAGEARILGDDMATNRHQVAARMNFSSPYVELPYRLTIRQNLTVYGKLYGVSDARDRIAHLADDLNLTALLDRPSGQLSAGQKTRLTLAKALINRPEVLLLDEPTASLDPDTGDYVRQYLADYLKQTGATMLLASHNMPEVERLCDHVLMLRGGKLYDAGAPRALIERYGRQNLEEVFLDIARQTRAQPQATEPGDDV